MPGPRLHRCRDVLELERACFGKRDRAFACNLRMDRVRDQHAALGRLGLQPRRDIDPVAEDVLAIDDDVAEIDADPELDRLLGPRLVEGRHGALDGDRTIDRVHGAGKFNQRAVAHSLDDPPAMGQDGRVECLRPDIAQRRYRAGLVLGNQSRISNHVGRDDGGKAALGSFCGHSAGSGCGFAQTLSPRQPLLQFPDIVA